MQMPSASISSRYEDSASENEIFENDFEPEEFYFDSEEVLDEQGTVVNKGSQNTSVVSQVIHNSILENNLNLTQSLTTFKEALDAQIELTSKEGSPLKVINNTIEIPHPATEDLPEKPQTAPRQSSRRPPTVPSTPRSRLRLAQHIRYPSSLCTESEFDSSIVNTQDAATLLAEFFAVNEADSESVVAGSVQEIEGQFSVSESRMDIEMSGIKQDTDITPENLERIARQLREIRDFTDDFQFREQLQQEVAQIEVTLGGPELQQQPREHLESRENLSTVSHSQDEVSIASSEQAALPHFPQYKNPNIDSPSDQTAVNSFVREAKIDEQAK